MSYHAKYLEILPHIEKEVREAKPGSRLPPIRAMMSRYGVSQSVIERCLDKLDRQGLVSRKRGSGVYVNGFTSSSRILGVFTDSEMPPLSTSLFLEGARNFANPLGYQVADFGPQNIFEELEGVMMDVENMGLAGIITDISTVTFFRLENEALVNRFRNLKLPIVTCFPLRGLRADSVVQDNFDAFQRLGAHYRHHSRGPIRFLGYQGIPTLARLKGFMVGLGSMENLRITLLNKIEETVFQYMDKIKENHYRENIIIAIPPDETMDLEVFSKFTRESGTDYQLTLLLETGTPIPAKVSCHVVERDTKTVGKAASELLLERIRGMRVEPVHRIIPHRIRWANES